MGVKGLLPCLQSIARSVSLERYRGLTVAVDAMSWLHKGVFACDVKSLAKSQRENESCEKPTSAELRCINYAINKAEALQAKFDIEVIFVIDGDSLPSKKEENAQRRKERDEAFDKAVAAEKARDSRVARRFYAQSCSVTHKIRYELIKACKRLGISFLVAPYEADAQMARLAHTGAVDLVVTEDSDILVYGCPRALFKVDFDTYRGHEIQLMKDLGENDALSFRNWTHDMFVFMCIISGCDYCKGVPGIGIKIAHKIVRVHRSPSKIFGALRAAGRMPSDFEDKFWIAFRTFRHQRVFCPSKQRIETLWPIAGSNHDANPNEVWPFLGEFIEPHIARRIANGTFHPSKKIEWNKALKSHHASESLPTRLEDMWICRGPSTSNLGQNRLNADNGKSNMWHSLVYGRKDDDRLSRQADGAENMHHNSTKNDGLKKGMFNFFPPNKKQGKEHAEESRGKPALEDPKTQPPIKEIYVDADLTSQPNSKYLPPAHHKDVPIHFHEYASQLVGKTFKPISRKRRKRENDGTKSSKCVQKIWEKCAEVHRPANEKRESGEDEGTGKEAQGVSFLKRNSITNASARFDYEIEGQMGQDYFHIPQQLHDTGPNLYDQRQDSIQHSHMSVVETCEDGLQLSHGLPSKQRVKGYQQWYPEDFSSSATTCEESSSRVETESHVQHFKQQPALESYLVTLPQSHLHSKCISFEESDIKRAHLLEKLQSFSDFGASYNDTTIDRHNCQASDDEYGMEDDREVFNVLKTDTKNRRDSHNYVDHIMGPAPAPDVCYSYNDIKNGPYHCQTSYDKYGVGEGVEVFNLLKTAKKSNVDREDQYHCQNSHHDEQDIEEGMKVFNLPKTAKKGDPDHDVGCIGAISSSCHSHCQTSHDTYAEGGTEVFNLLKTAKKNKPYNHEAPYPDFCYFATTSKKGIEVKRNASSCRYYLDHDDPDPDVCCTAMNSYGIDERGMEVFNLLKTTKKNDLPYHNYIDHLDLAVNDEIITFGDDICESDFVDGESSKAVFEYGRLNF